MKASVCISMFMFLLLGAKAQTIWKDFEYKAPAAYKKVDNSNRLVLENFVGKQYCQLIIFPLEQTSANAAEAFNLQWNFFARNASQGVGDPETKETEVVEGWTYTFGAARGSYKGQMFAITLSSRYKEGHTYFVATVVSDKQFLEDAQAFTNAVALTKEKAATLKTAGNGQAPNDKSFVAAGIVSTTFEDGWNSTYRGAYVAVTNGPVTAWIFPVNDSLDKVGRKPDEHMEDRYWRYTVDRFFETRHVAERPWQMSGPGTDRIFEAEVKNRETGEEGFVAMRVVWNSGRAQTVLAFSKRKADLYAGVFAKYSSFEDVLLYNKFQLTAQALEGDWYDAQSGASGSYSVAGGFMGGKGAIRTKDHFLFTSQGTYKSSHSINQSPAQAAGDGYTQRYEGGYLLSGTTLQLTRWRQDDPGAFECWMEARLGGLALIMINKKFTGQRFTLIKN